MTQEVIGAGKSVWVIPSSFVQQSGSYVATFSGEDYFLPDTDTRVEALFEGGQGTPPSRLSFELFGGNGRIYYTAMAIPETVSLNFTVPASRRWPPSLKLTHWSANGMMAIYLTFTPVRAD